MKLSRPSPGAADTAGCLLGRRLSSHEVPEATQLYGSGRSMGLDLSHGNSCVSSPRQPGTAHALSFVVETLTWGSQQTASRWATLTGARPLPDDAKQGPLVLAIFVVTQLLDGVLTYWGVTRFGIELEMNTLLAMSMHFVGPGAALFAAKGLACACGLVLYCNAYLRPLAAVAGLCLGLAVIPWIIVVGWTI